MTRGCDIMSEGFIFRRYELKYLLDECQTSALYEALKEHMSADRYGPSSIRNMYFDTPDYLLARRSISRPLYKEKLRFRSYGRPSGDDEIFVELKKKYDSVVYKRRLSMRLDDAMDWFCGEGERPHTQIGDEIDYMRVRYPGIRPAMFLSYDREAYCTKDCRDLRITVDRNILARMEDIDLTSETYGHPILPDGYTLMEIKTMFGYPQWLTSLLSSNGICKTRFSKYGNAYKEMVLGKMPEEYYRIPRAESTVLREARTEGCS